VSQLPLTLPEWPWLVMPNHRPTAKYMQTHAHLSFGLRYIRTCMMVSQASKGYLCSDSAWYSPPTWVAVAYGRAWRLSQPTCLIHRQPQSQKPLHTVKQCSDKGTLHRQKPRNAQRIKVRIQPTCAETQCRNHLQRGSGGHG
jgi:hypothetical protein